MQDREVLIVGAGPTGLVLALWLTKLGVTVRVLDKATGPGTTSRALAVQARTLELYRQLDLTDALLTEGHRVPAANFWVEGSRRAHIELGALGEGLTPYPYVFIYPQDKHERLLIERLEAVGVTVERQTELTEFTDHGDHISARFRRADGSEESCQARYIVGCDGARSVVRHAIGAEFPGGTYRQMFYVADIEGSGPMFNGELHIDLDEADFVVLFPLDMGRCARLIGVVKDDRDDDSLPLRFEDISDKAIRNLNLQIDKVNWFSTYRVHHRVADKFRQGSAFLAGDAGHIHSPAGGQGMNTGIGDAINLAWKLAAVLKGKADDSLLDTYEAERIAFARKLVETTDQVFTFVTAEGRVADIVRTRIAPLVFPLATRIHAAREFLFRTVSQTMITYQGSTLSEGKAGDIHGGDRLPWVPVNGIDNFDSLAEPTWQVHVYGTASLELTQWCTTHSLPLHQFAWSSEYEAAGLAHNAAYLLRPDTYIALADPTGSPTALERYRTDHHLQ
ncbi:MAG: FAD-dependent monooxygenase [Armatimonas sp.]